MDNKNVEIKIIELKIDELRQLLMKGNYDVYLKANFDDKFGNTKSYDWTW